MRLPDLVRTTTFRWTLAISAAFTLCILLMFAFVFWQTIAFMSANIDRLNSDVTNLIASDGEERMAQKIADHLRVDPRRVKLTGLFDQHGNRLIGNIETLPPAVTRTDTPQWVSLVRIDALGREEQRARAAARKLPSGETLLVARNADELRGIAGIVKQALGLGLIPALCLSLVAGTFLSLRAQKRVEQVTGKIQRIVAGELQERLPSHGINDPFDRLAVLVNGMLDEIGRLVENLAGVGDDIAHDLRTPLTRVRVGLERGRLKAANLEELQSSVDQAIVGLDQTLAIITALLRIAEIEHSRRVAAFRDVALTDIVREIGELYEPIAEDKRIAFRVDTEDELVVRADRDLLFEAVANLVDNAVKFTPEAGHVDVTVLQQNGEAIIRVRDTGPGIAAEEHDLVGTRFYRSDKSRREPGLGLGLSLVNAIARLHGFRFTISSGPDCVAEIAAAPITASLRPSDRGMMRTAAK